MRFFSVLYETGQRTATCGLAAKRSVAPNSQSDIYVHIRRGDSKDVQSYVSSLVVKNSIL